MFGYVQVRKAELKVKDYELYHSFYCGLCHALKDGHGLKGQITLTYDCTFLVMLLSSLYELDVEKSMSRCIETCNERDGCVALLRGYECVFIMVSF